MFKKILLILALMCMIIFPVFSQTGSYTTHNLFYLPEYGAYGVDEYNEYNTYMEIADAQIWANKTAITAKQPLDAQLTDIAGLTPTDSYFIVGDGVNWIVESGATARASLGIDLSLYYLKTEIDSQSEVETIWGVDLVTKTGDFTAGRMTKINNATGIIEQGTNTDTDVADAVTKKHAANADTDLDATFEATFAKKADKLDIFAATTEAELYTVLSDVILFLEDLVDDTTPELGGQLQAGAHSINFTEQVLTSGTAIAWNLGNSNKATLTAAHNFTITITAPSGALNAQLIITQDGTGTRVMDEIVTQSDATVATTDVHTDTEIVDLTIDIPTGARIRIDNQEGTDVPEPLVENTVYWAIRTSENHIQFATTKANAIAGTDIDITDTGTGTHTVEQLVKWTGGTLGVLTTDAGAEDILSLTYKTGDKQWYAQLGKNFQ